MGYLSNFNIKHSNMETVIWYSGVSDIREFYYNSLHRYGISEQCYMESRRWWQYHNLLQVRIYIIMINNLSKLIITTGSVLLSIPIKNINFYQSDIITVQSWNCPTIVQVETIPHTVMYFGIQYLLHSLKQSAVESSFMPEIMIW